MIKISIPLLELPHDCLQEFFGRIQIGQQFDYEIRGSYGSQKGLDHQTG